MFFALNCNGERISIENATKDNQYFCEECNTPVIIKAKDSQCMRPHFAHKHRSDCWYDYENCMSEWHYNWQCYFPKECREFVVVNKKTGIKHRADIYINNTIVLSPPKKLQKGMIFISIADIMWCGYLMRRIKLRMLSKIQSIL